MNCPATLGSPPPDPGVDKPSMEPQASILATSLVSHIEHGMATAPRSRQVNIGASELGMGLNCPRQLAYRMHNQPKVNWTDSCRLLVGVGMHLALGEIFERMAAESGRWLVEHRVTYRGVAGSLDLYDKATATIIDWKSTSKARLASYTKQGPPRHYLTQLAIYAAGLRQQGYLVSRVGLAFIPYDGAIAGLWVWLGEPDRRMADDAVEFAQRMANEDPAQVEAVPGRYCGFCDYYLPTSTDLAIGCPGTANHNGGIT